MRLFLLNYFLTFYCTGQWMRLLSLGKNEERTKNESVADAYIFSIQNYLCKISILQNILVYIFRQVLMQDSRSLNLDCHASYGILHGSSICSVFHSVLHRGAADVIASYARRIDRETTRRRQLSLIFVPQQRFANIYLDFRLYI